MARRRQKKRTHVGASQPPNKAASASTSSRTDPKSMVIRIGAGEVGSSVSQLATDVRKVMEPGTASRLKERRGNKLKDYVVMAGPLGVTHLMLFSRSESGNTNLRVALAPRGPTLNFRVEQYSLCKDVQRAQRHPRGLGKEFLSPPLLVMNNFTSPNSTANSKVPRHLETLTTTVFQSLFPPINPQTTPLKSIRRVLLLNREQNEDEDDGSFIVNFRHYAITTRVTGVSRQLRRLNEAEKLAAPKTSRKAAMPNLGKLQDIADYMIGGEGGDGGYMTDATSGSELDTDNEVEVLEPSRKRVASNRGGHAAAAAAAVGAEFGGADGGADAGDHDEEENVERRAVKMVELGPRMRLRLTKVEDGLCAGKVMWHEYVHKSPEEVRELEKRWEQRRREKEARRKEQKANVDKKRKANEENKVKNGGGKDGDEDDEMEDYDDDFYSDGYQDVDGGEFDEGDDNEGGEFSEDE